jgi:hypothetical protein
MDDENKTENENKEEQNEEKQSELNKTNEDKKSNVEKENIEEEKEPEKNPDEVSEKKSQNDTKSEKSEIQSQASQRTKNEKIIIDASENRKASLLMTEVTQAIDAKDLYSYHDLIVPGGKNAHLCFLNDPNAKNLRVTEVADHYHFYDPISVIVLIGANTNEKIKLFAGISRAALNCRAIILDSGVESGIEKFCLRKNIDLIGIAPESQIDYPKADNNEFSESLLTNGHSHFILLRGDKVKWGDEAKFKISFADRLASGRKNAFPYKAKVVGVVCGNLPNCVNECKMFMEKQWPLVLMENSEFCKKIKEVKNLGEDDNSNIYGEDLGLIGKYQKLMEIDDDSENLAASIHIALTLSF